VKRVASVALLALVAALGAACGDDDGTCGAAQPAPTSAALVSAGAQSFTYEGFHAGLNGDCPVEVGSRGSVTISGTQVGSGFALTFCVRRENDVQSGQPISLADDGFILVVDVNARDAAGCSYGKDTGAVATGTVTFDGFCTSAGTQYNMVLAGSIPGLEQCPAAGGMPATSTPVALGLAGSVLVTMD
jgi:hypothetical protein